VFHKIRAHALKKYKYILGDTEEPNYIFTDEIKYTDNIGGDIGKYLWNSFGSVRLLMSTFIQQGCNKLIKSVSQDLLQKNIFYVK